MKNWFTSYLLLRINSPVAGDGYVAIHIIPERVDLMDESRGWGARETLEI